MTIDPYPELPPLSLVDQLDLDDLQPEHFHITTEAMTASKGVDTAVARVVRHHIGYLGEDEVIRVTARILIAGRGIIEQARDSNGDVTPSD
ncbi:hypothetical protein [Mycobacteroides abscessus]|uniref:hypothetical protein n=1 Tax=Mycobacteroides abscessus TaxID=36809 RepID=UPI00092B1BD3|nr:hypothetical protein [Mycobacteroides abscessus]SHT48541.1 Uncharacterised protein [Mycobacteroides abscessus subsp. abscessus]SHT61445.1 Uncharacterised protein [Mycobacteroides abscessus subsp. abscessus]SKK64039.1 Uncharacterised protein [Mycobacteroides abscessus subsp. abscessus]